MRLIMAIVIALLLPLQSLYAVSALPCVVTGTASHTPFAMDDRAPDHSSELASHHPKHYTLDLADLVIADESKLFITSDCLAHESNIFDGCCHVVVSLPVQSVLLAILPPANVLHGAPVMASMPHMTSGPFRPPRTLLA